MITIKRGASTQAQVEIDERTVFSKKLMGEHKITAEFFVENPLDIEIGDYIEHDGEVFTMNRTPEITKINLKTFKYKVDFEGQIYDLYNKLYMHDDGLADFHYTGKPADFLTLIINNINSISSGWSVGVVEDASEQTIRFEGDSCRTALTRIAETFGFEFALSGKQISLKKTVGDVTTYEFEYGRGNGLYQLDRKQVSSQNVVTRVYGFGSEKNIPYDYRNGDRSKRLVFEKNGKRYLEQNVDLYGVIEAQFTDDTIFPTRTGRITGVNIHFGDMALIPPDWPEFYVEDSNIDFDINQYLLEGESAKIAFKSGDMSGYEFDITKYDHDTKRIYFEKFSEQDGYTLPSDTVQPTAGDGITTGDQYTLVNIKMPTQYVTDAETRLQAATQEYLNQNCKPMVIYGLEFDKKYVKDNSVGLDIGDMVTIVDAQLGLTNETIRVSEVTYPLVNPNKLKATIADFVPYTIQERTIKTAVDAKKETYFVERKTAELARRNTASLNRLKDYLLDQDGYFTNPIRPRSIETLYLSVGAKPSNLRLSGATFKENYNGDVNSFFASACQVVHLEFENDGGDYTWTINNDETFIGLTSGEAYYLYAKCSKTDLTGSWHLTTDVVKSEPAGENFYYFGVGVLLPVDSETAIRDFLTTYGKTYINGRNITTGKVQSIDGQSYIDLDANRFRVGGLNSSIDWNHTTQDTLTIRGAVVQSPAGTEFPIGVYRGVYDGSNTYFKGDQVTYNGATWLYINDSSSSGNTPTAGVYWTEIAARGDQGIPGTTSYFHVAYADSIDGSVNFNQVSGEYIGTYVDSNATDSSNPADYNWVLLKGAQGEQGIAGLNGDSGETSYLHIKYSPDGVNFSGNNGEDVADWIGTYVDFESQDSVVFSDYSWKKIKGEDGAVGPQGDQGIPGTSSYFHVAYADSSDGSVNFNQVNGEYIGTYVDDNPTDSSDPADYNWVLVKGSQGEKGDRGIAGLNGDSGETSYLHIKYSPDGVNFSGSNGEDLDDWIGTYVDFNSTDSMVFSRYDWKKIKGEDGDLGPTGPGAVFKGDYQSGVQYYGGTDSVDVVIKGGSCYIAKTTAGTISVAPPSSQWASCGGEFEVVATKLLLSEEGYIDNLWTKNLKTSTGDKRVEISAADNEIEFYENNDLKIRIGSYVEGETTGIHLHEGSVKIDTGRLVIGGTYYRDNIDNLKWITFNPQFHLLVPHNSLFLDTATGKLSFKRVLNDAHWTIPLHD